MNTIFDFNKKESRIPYGLFPVRKDTFIYFPLLNRGTIRSSLELYQPSNILRRIHKQFLRCLPGFLLKRLLFKEFVQYETKEEIHAIFSQVNGYACMAIYTGTPGLNQKFTIQLMDPCGGILGYAKVPKSEISRILTENEKEVLEQLGKYKLSRTKVPMTLIYQPSTGVLVQSVEGSYNKKKFGLNQEIIESLAEIFYSTNQKVALSDSLIKGHIELLKQDKNDMIRCVGENAWWIHQQFRGQELSFCLVHKDFAPWNIRTKEDKLYVFDWEFAETNIGYYDIFNFVVQTEMLVHKKKENKIVEMIMRHPMIKEFESKTGLANRQLYFMLFLVELIHFQFTRNTDQNAIHGNRILMSAMKMFQIVFDQYEGGSRWE